jgi:nucleoside-diphosphate-sugar epimerase
MTDETLARAAGSVCQACGRARWSAAGAAKGSAEGFEESIGLEAKRELLPMQPGDVPATYADVDDLMRDVGFRPATPIADGITRFIEWYRAYHHR